MKVGANLRFSERNTKLNIKKQEFIKDAYVFLTVDFTDLKDFYSGGTVPQKYHCVGTTVPLR